jgi:hypothetical protein
MKATILRNTMLATALVAGLAFTSCKEKAEDADTNTTTTDSTSGMTSEPIGDTIVSDKDTVVETGTANDTKENSTGTQVP